MPTRIRQLKCRVTVRAGRKVEGLFRGSKSERPSMHFALPLPEPKAESMPAPGEVATEDPEEAVAPRQVDPRAVADRVYELMKQEVTLSRIREGRR